jgi:hypothetical protein
MRMLKAHPDYHTVSPEYVASLMALLDRYPPEIMVDLSDLQHGLPSRCKRLPTPADIVEMADELAEKHRQRKQAQENPRDTMRALSMDDYEAVRRGLPVGHHLRFRPFPRLWEAFEDDTEITTTLNSGLAFEELSAASKLLATESKHVAREYLAGRKGM